MEDEEEQQGSPPEGREDDPDAPSETGEPTNDDQDPPRGDQHDDESDRALAELAEDSLDEDETISETLRTEVIGQLVSEIQAWKKFVISRIKRGMRVRPYHTDLIPEDISELVQEQLEYAEDMNAVIEIFDDLFELMKEIENE